MTECRNGFNNPICVISKTEERVMFKFPLVTVYAIVAFNITVFTALLQMNYLIFQSPVAKAIAWAFTLAAWGITYMNRHKFYTINLTGNNKLHHE